ncbi:MAG: O-acetyl-ADP-ribose deacetylase [Lachnospiraceae bacterium]|nr:O-acetyl-ADP-ribose deacetylase [Lachnospiraceae bacterium]
MPLLFIRQDITTMHVDAVVNAANESLLGGGGVDGAIHYAAGPELLAECRTLGGCRTGEAKITGGYRMPCRYIIHTVGPVYKGGDRGEPELLAACYRNSLKLAVEHGCESVAFPAISTGVYGYPPEEATKIAVATVREFLEEHDMTVYLVFFGHGRRQSGTDLALYVRDRLAGNAMAGADAVEAVTGRAEKNDSSAVFEMAFEPEDAKECVADLEECAEEVADECISEGSAKRKAHKADRDEGASEKRKFSAKSEQKSGGFKLFSSKKEASAMSCAMMDAASAAAPDFRSMLDESFSEMLLRKIDEAGMTDAECYKRANIDRKLFSKIRSDRLYRPSKATAIAFAVALKLGTAETEEMLRKAGYALSNSALFDVIIRYFIERGEYDVMKINEALFDYDQALLGA